MPAPASYARRQFPGAASDTTISGAINNSVTACSLTSTSGWPTGAYTGGILCELYSTATGVTAEKVWATDLTGSTLTIVRAADGTSAASHAAGTGIRPCAGAIDADEANKAAHETVGQVSAAGSILVSDGANSFTALDAKTSGRILVGNGSTLVSVAVSGDATLAASGALTIAAGAVDEAMLSFTLPADRWNIGPFCASSTTGFGSITAMNFGTVQAPWVAPVSGSIIGLSVAHTIARASGSIFYEVYKNGAGTGLTVTIDGTNPQYHRTTQASGTDTFAAGDRLEVWADDSSVTASAVVANILVEAD